MTAKLKVRTFVDIWLPYEKSPVGISITYPNGHDLRIGPTLGLQPPVSLKVKKGCPLDSFELADLWREANTQRTRRVNPSQLAKHIAEEQGDNRSPEDGILIPLATAKDIAFRGYDFILGLVEHLPENTAPQCNPGNPQIAFAVLKSEWTYILCNASEAYAAWSKIEPHISTASIATEHAVE